MAETLQTITPNASNVATPSIGQTNNATYTFYDQTYNYSDLLKLVNSDWQSFKNKIKHGNKHEEFEEAKNNLLAGIQSGRITYDPTENVFVDSSGEYTNGKGHKDYYGKAAYYIVSKMQALADQTIALKAKEEKEAREKKFKFNDANSNGAYILREIYNGANNGNISSFIKMDNDYNPNTKKRSITKRTERLITELEKLRDNYSNIFDVDEEKAEKQKGYLQAAIDALSDGTFDDNDYMTLEAALGNYSWEKMFNTTWNGENGSPEENEEIILKEKEEAQKTKTAKKEAFNNWFNEKFNGYQRKRNDSKLTLSAHNNTANLLNKNYSKKDLIKMVNLIVNKDDKFSKTLYDNHISVNEALYSILYKLTVFLSKDSNGYYRIPGISKTGRIYLFNVNNNNIDFIQRDMLNDKDTKDKIWAWFERDYNGDNGFANSFNEYFV